MEFPKKKKKVDQTAGLFDRMKVQILSQLVPGGPSAVDLSPKGSVDELCVPMMDTLNNHTDYVTTSSCSGRVSVWAGVEKGEGGWLVSSHATIDPDAVVASLTPFPSTGAVILKMEPFVMHVQCRDLAASHKVLVAALHAGFRNSGVIPGKKRVMLAIRHTMTLEVPLGQDGVRMVDDAYVAHITAIANTKLLENFSRIELLHKTVVAALAGEGPAAMPEDGEEE